jgi:hypothetical protein
VRVMGPCFTLIEIIIITPHLLVENASETFCVQQICVLPIHVMHEYLWAGYCFPIHQMKVVDLTHGDGSSGGSGAMRLLTESCLWSM